MQAFAWAKNFKWQMAKSKWQMVISNSTWQI